MSHDIDEALIGLRSSLAADSELTALLGDAAQIYREKEPRTKVIYPILTIICDTDNPAIGNSGTGVWRPDVEIGIQAKHESTCRAIQGVLDANWNIPLNRQAAITTENFAITLMRRVNSIRIGPVGLIATDEQIHLITTLWQLRIHKTA